MVKYKNFDEAMPVLKQWLTTQPHLPIIEDMPLRAFIIFCDGDLEEAKLLINKQYSFRTSNQHIFANRNIDSDAFKKLHDLIDIIVMPDRTPDNHCVIIYRIRTPDTTNYNFAEQVRLITAYFDAMVRIQRQEDSPDGIYIVMDFTHFTIQHLTKVDLSAARVLARFFEEFTSVKIPRSHIINCPTFINRAVAVARTFLSEKTVKKFLIHETNPDEIFDYIPRNLLPIDINGTKGKIDDLKVDGLQKLKENRNYILDDKFWFVDESKRPANSRIPQFNQMEGNFRTLSVD